MRKQITVLLAENTQMSARSIEMQKQTGKMRKQRAFLLAETTEMGKRMDKMRRQTAILPIESAVKSKRSPHTLLHQIQMFC
ncbi:hypothetical protein C7B82_21745 [Stenomitos frigidus ULC18]|uniref:Uncharacterized protein n=1 Tax=Stenomitos frigidus ULC18 TaxID=2107698 RepID=A0A2T1DZD5_9CYAN|nr:hypothetical protein C7B82_21745 [Stenomitos frigidus ULC18]